MFENSRVCDCGARGSKVDKGRAMDGRRAYRCRVCGSVWTNGMQGRERQYSVQRPYYQFHDTGAAAGECRLDLSWYMNPEMSRTLHSPNPTKLKRKGFYYHQNQRELARSSPT